MAVSCVTIVHVYVQRKERKLEKNTKKLGTRSTQRESGLRNDVYSSQSWHASLPIGQLDSLKKTKLLR